MSRGVLGRIADHRVIGWAIDDSDPAVRLTVRGRIGKRELGRSEAWISRAHRQPVSGEEDSPHGYALQVPFSLKRAQLAKLMVQSAP
jgi:hypothetical protein